MIIRSFFIFLNLMIGLAMGIKLESGSLLPSLLGAGLMLAFSLTIIWYEHHTFSLRPVETLGGLTGFSVGLGLSGVTSLVNQQIFVHSPEFTPLLTFATLIGFCYMGTTLGLRIARTFCPPSESPQTFTPVQTQKILDTSAIIDGGIADLCKTEFLEGSVIIPQFVLLELQSISDSSDPHKRLRGKRGLEILQTIQEMETADVHIVHDDFPQIQEVDTKLVELAKQPLAKLITTDMNLNKVASLQGIQVLNANDLSNAIRPVVIYGLSLFCKRDSQLIRSGTRCGSFG